MTESFELIYIAIESTASVVTESNFTTEKKSFFCRLGTAVLSDLLKALEATFFWRGGLCSIGDLYD